jgi:hypothetical protein
VPFVDPVGTLRYVLVLPNLVETEAEAEGDLNPELVAQITLAGFEADASALPYWRMNLGGGPSALNIPLEIPMHVGSGVVDYEYTIPYPGTANSSPIIYFFGPIQNPCLYNTTTGLQLVFENYFVLAGGYVAIDCRQPSPRVYDQFGVSREPLLSDDSNLDTFYLAPGDNNVHITGTDIDADSAIEVHYAIKEKP